MTECQKQQQAVINLLVLLLKVLGVQQEQINQALEVLNS